jgi:transcriptional regulator with XRE-family HTH domain
MTPEQFKQNRKELGLEQKDLAVLLYCSTVLISCYEQGTRDINKSPLRLERYQKLINNAKKMK